MKFSEIANRVTGISTPFVGLNWQPGELEITAARRVLAFLEDRRVLFSPHEWETPRHSVQSVIEIRHHLSEEIGKLGSGSRLAGSLRAMRAACRKFLDNVGTHGSNENFHGGFQSFIFFTAIGEMRGTFGIHIAQIAAEFRLDVEDELASILPGPADDDDEARQSRRRR